MVSATGLTTLLLASAALAGPAMESRVKPRAASRQFNTTKNLEAVAPIINTRDDNGYYNEVWGGATYNYPQDTFIGVSGILTVPNIPITATTSGSLGIAVGIDGVTSITSYLQSGLDITITRGVFSCNAWSYWYPDNRQNFSGITFHPGDVVRFSVNVYSIYSGNATVENLTTGDSAARQLGSTAFPLLLQDAVWIVQDFVEAGAQVPIYNFGTVVFSSAIATTFDGRYTSSGSSLLTIKQNNHVLTRTRVDGDILVIKYLSAGGT